LALLGGNQFLELGGIKEGWLVGKGFIGIVAVKVWLELGKGRKELFWGLFLKIPRLTWKPFH